MYSDKSGGVILVFITYTFSLIHIYMTAHILAWYLYSDKSGGFILVL